MLFKKRSNISQLKACEFDCGHSPSEKAHYNPNSPAQRIKTFLNLDSAPIVHPFDNIYVQTTDGQDVLLSDTWKNNTVILKVLARLNCALCKYETSKLNQLKPLFDKHNITFVAVSFEDITLEDFLTAGHWNWDIFIDTKRKVYDAANLIKMSPGQFILNILSVSFHKLLSVLAKKGHSNPPGGDHRQLGGTFIINPRGEMLYQFKPTRMGMFPSIKELYEIIGGDPQEIDDEFPKFTYTAKEMERLSMSSRRSSSKSSLNSY